MLEALAAGLVGVAILWLVLEPLLTGGGVARVEGPAEWEPPDPEETARGRALLALKEIEFDRATGKLSDHDYDQLHTRYQAQAVAALDGCQRCGEANRPVARYCRGCGVKLPETN